MKQPLNNSERNVSKPGIIYPTYQSHGRVNQKQFLIFRTSKTDVLPKQCKEGYRISKNQSSNTRQEKVKRKS